MKRSIFFSFIASQKGDGLSKRRALSSRGRTGGGVGCSVWQEKRGMLLSNLSCEKFCLN